MQIGVPKETALYENRIAITPDSIKKFIKLGHSIVVERDAGKGSFITNDALEQAGAQIVEDAISTSDVVLTVNSLPIEKINQLKQEAIVIGMMNPYRNANLQDYANRHAKVYAMELLPRTLSRAQNMDVLSSQANLAGYKAVILAANQFGRPFPMFMTSAGTVKPARIVILGVGIAGLQAIATARRLGAVVEASDLRPTVRDQVESVGGKWLDVPMSDEEKAKAKDTNDKFISKYHSFIERIQQTTHKIAFHQYEEEGEYSLAKSYKLPDLPQALQHHTPFSLLKKLNVNSK